MSRASRESVFAALYAAGPGSLAPAPYGSWSNPTPPLKQAGRKLVQLTDSQPEQMPQAFQLQDDQEVLADKQPQLPPKNFWKASWVVYASSSDITVPPSQVLNGLVELLLATLAPSPAGDFNTLGGLVTYARVEGKIQIFEGLTGERCVAIIPVVICLAGF